MRTRLRFLGIALIPFGLLTLKPGPASCNEPSLFFYCPVCGFEMPSRPGQEKTTPRCPRCGKKRVDLQLTKYPHGGDYKAPSNKLVPIIGFGIPLVLGCVWLLLSKRWLSVFLGRKVPVAVCRCPSCNRK